MVIASVSNMTPRYVILVDGSSAFFVDSSNHRSVNGNPNWPNDSRALAFALSQPPRSSE